MLWHPDVATQLVLASEDDRLPVIQMWDLRFATSPLKVFENHTRSDSRLILPKHFIMALGSAVGLCGDFLSEQTEHSKESYFYRGILSISWSQADPELLLSSAKDNRILCWNPNTGEVTFNTVVKPLEKSNSKRSIQVFFFN